LAAAGFGGGGGATDSSSEALEANERRGVSPEELELDVTRVGFLGGLKKEATAEAAF